MSELDHYQYTIAPDKVGSSWPFDTFEKEHGKYHVVGVDSKRGTLVYGIFEDADNKQIITCVSDIVKKYNKEEFEINKHNLVVIVLDSGLYCVCKKWEDVNLDENDNEQYNNLSNTSTSAIRLYNLLQQHPIDSSKIQEIYHEKSKEIIEKGIKEIREDNKKSAELAAKMPDITLEEIDFNKCATLIENETEPTASHYIAVLVDMIIVVAIGIYVYNRHLINKEEDMALFILACCFLAIIDWFYPYYETSIYIDHNSFFARGCIRPIIGVFGILFFPLFIHYWLYKGIKTILLLFRNQDDE